MTFWMILTLLFLGGWIFGRSSSSDPSGGSDYECNDNNHNGICDNEERDCICDDEDTFDGWGSSNDDSSWSSYDNED